MIPIFQNDGALIFAYHSHRAVRKVRKIRNYLEEEHSYAS